MPVIGCAVLPHSAMVLDPKAPNCPEGIQEIHDGCIAVGEVIAAWEPELIVFLTPHGISAPKSPRPGIYLTPSATGLLEDEDSDPNNGNYELAIQIDADVATGFLDHLGSAGVACVKITGTEAPLSSSEIIPLWFMRRVALLKRAPKYMLLSLPTPVGGSSSVRSQTAKERIPDLIQYAHHLHKYLNWLPHRSAVVLSGNLAHTHATRCKDPRFIPKPDQKLPISDAAAVFDGMVEKWASTLNGNFLLQDAAALVKEAISCGFDGLVVLQAIIEREGKSKFSSHVFARHRPTYVGMLCAVFQADRRVPNPELAFQRVLVDEY
ncbi:uncharacterized protein EV422DRAFT_23107 [Fimicolochytrium jonesii]|uniref:uncharacterized protein n=1 Tax=Fimicolochytrium jonesii TaxID=1396493 RepID=UPI0022FEB7E5|nr:uncharacterized protein EV422DRAFT_23107 [Fimicolochytrium jonesii]KAI8827034.1 hypothetical protein EV422DRAFT_23107 [Fimicolochytrium jonesii]